jgi:uncharacterized coiled-coil protein SlyX
MGSILKTIVITAGAGVALGICTTASSRRAPRRESIRRKELNADDLIDIEPLLGRLETIERRFEAAAAPKPVVPVTELTRRIDAHDAEIERLRGLVDSRANAIQAHLEAEMDERHQRSFAALEQTVEIRISDRIAALERKLSEQSVSIDELRERAQDTDTNIKRLIVAIEKLVERTPIPAVQAGVPVLVPFEAHLNEARVNEEAAAEFRPRMFQEAEPKKRFPLARIFGMIALLVGASGLTQILS